MAYRWYIIHTHSGFEKKVVAAIEESAAKKGLSDCFEEITVPVETFIEVRKGKKVNSERKFFPGYVLAKMEMTEDAWQIVKNTPRVTGFLGGGGNKPSPVSPAEIERIFKNVEEGVNSPKSSIIYKAGDEIKITDGPFDSFVGIVEDVDNNKNKLKVAVSIFGRSTPVELDFTQVEQN